MLRSDQIEALGIAVLAVGLWPAARVRAALPALIDAKVMDATEVAQMDLGVLTVALARNGYNRGLLTSMYAERLKALMVEVVEGHLDSLPELAKAGDGEAFLKRLREIHGVGPKVALNALAAIRDLG